jgi:hypothetical protein
VVDLFDQAAKCLALQNATPHCFDAGIALAIPGQSPLVNLTITHPQPEERIKLPSGGCMRQAAFQPSHGIGLFQDLSKRSLTFRHDPGHADATQGEASDFSQGGVRVSC